MMSTVASVDGICMIMCVCVCVSDEEGANLYIHQHQMEKSVAKMNDIHTVQYLPLSKLCILPVFIVNFDNIDFFMGISLFVVVDGKAFGDNDLDCLRR